jgi:hypothetical protein
VRRYIKYTNVAATLALIAAALAGTTAPALADCIGEEPFNQFYTDVLATNQGAFVMYGAADAETPTEPLVDEDDESVASLYALPASPAGHARRIKLGVRGAFTSATTLFESAGQIRTLVWREGPGRHRTAILGGLANVGPLKPIVSPAGSPGYAPIAVGALSGGGYAIVVPAPEAHGPAMLQVVNADGTLGPKTSLGAVAAPDPSATSEYALTQASDGSIWVAGPGLLARWVPGEALTIVAPTQAPLKLAPGAEGTVWELTPGEGLIHAGAAGILSRAKIPAGEGASMASGEVLATSALATRADGSAVIAYGNRHGAFLASTDPAGTLGAPRRISKQSVLSVEGLDLQPGTDTPFVSVTNGGAAAIYAVGKSVRVTKLPAVSHGFSSTRPLLGFAPNGRAWVVWTVRRGSFCAGSEDSREVWTTLNRKGRLGGAHTLGSADLWTL